VVTSSHYLQNCYYKNFCYSQQMSAFAKPVIFWTNHKAAVTFNFIMAPGRRGGIAHTHLGTRWGKVVSITPQQRFTPSKGTPVPIGQEAGLGLPNFTYAKPDICSLPPPPPHLRICVTYFKFSVAFLASKPEQFFPHLESTGIRFISNFQAFKIVVMI
jgi:hypothetical protein